MDTLVWVATPMDNMRIYHECEGRIEKSVQRIAVWHHEACRMMNNGDPEGRILRSYPHTNNGFFFLLTTVLILFLFLISLHKSLNTILRMYPIIYLYKSQRVLYRIEWENYTKSDTKHISSDTMIFISYALNIQSLL